MKRSFFTILAVAALLTLPVLSGAAPITFTVPDGESNTGVLSFLSDGTGTLLAGTGIALSFDGAGEGAPVPAVLDFTTYYTDGWSVTSGGALNVYSPDYNLLLLTGTFVSGGIVPSEEDRLLFTADFLDWVEPSFAAGYGNVGGIEKLWSGEFRLLFDAGVVDPGGEFVSTALLGGGGSTAPVPEPSTMILLGSGLVALRNFVRRKSARTA